MRDVYIVSDLSRNSVRTQQDNLVLIKTIALSSYSVTSSYSSYIHCTVSTLHSLVLLHVHILCTYFTRDVGQPSGLYNRTTFLFLWVEGWGGVLIHKWWLHFDTCHQGMWSATSRPKSCSLYLCSLALWIFAHLFIIFFLPLGKFTGL